MNTLASDCRPHTARRLGPRALAAAVLCAALVLLSLQVGSQGWEPVDWHGPQGHLLTEIRLPRTLGVLCLGLLLGLGGALAQGLFRNPLADPYLLGSGAGAALTVTLLAAASAGATSAWQMLSPLLRLGVVGVAFTGALGGALLTLMLARGAQHTHRLLLAGVVVGIVLGAMTDLVSTFVPDAWRQRQSLLLGHTALLGHSAAWLLAGTAAVALPLSMALARVLDALALGDDTAASLGLPVARLRLLLVGVMAACTAVAVSQAGLILFVGLAAPHIVRQSAPLSHRFSLAASAVVGAALLLGADILARWVLAPQELPVGVVTGVLGGLYLLVLLQRRQAA